MLVATIKKALNAGIIGIMMQTNPYLAIASNLEIIISDDQPVLTRKKIMELNKGKEIQHDSYKGVNREMILHTDKGDKLIGIKPLHFLKDGRECGYNIPSCDVSDANTLDIFQDIPSGKTRIDMSYGVSSRLLNYLKSGEHGDCSVFVHHLKGVEYMPNEDEPNKWNLDMDNWDIKPSHNLYAGDVVIFFGNKSCKNPKEEEITHFAIYLDNQLYLSRAGLDMPIFIADIENLKKAYGNCVNEIIPKK